MNVSYSTSISAMSEKKQRYRMLNSLDRGKVLWQASVNDGALPEDGYGEIYDFDWNNDLNNPVLIVCQLNLLGGDTNMRQEIQIGRKQYIKQDLLSIMTCLFQEVQRNPMPC
ncbi:hypothetical protein [Flavobacterium palustre]|uniref:hypothetical protein n=1 Tax=Flavobacterium palustre TaxID=1476463 RepID=UPI00360B6053